MTHSEQPDDQQQVRTCEKCSQVMVRLGEIRRSLQSTMCVYRCYNCNNVVVELK
ncbi:hypothetical protein [Rhodopseudomonas faecalis]|uniref:hypothetical protein n=1 Tax=Rhodopseudomonas faecalis TaxID=99655 RepID=UPI0015E8B74C|nr:hypothetical protein [Rhodopseudomonas faecalis]